MSAGARWNRCIWHRGPHTESFFREFLGQPHRQTLVVGGAGFDPRATVLCDLLTRIASSRVKGFFLREERPQPAQELVNRAERNQRYLTHLVPGSTIQQVSIFAPDDAVIGGRAAVGLLNQVALENFTDIFVDFSALSIGVAFPIVRHLLERAGHSGAPPVNLHLVVTDEPATDTEILSTSCDAASTIHGFKGGWGLDANSRAAKLWIPQLSHRKQAALERIHLAVEPHAVCPILPFPASNPRLPDELVEHYAEQFQNPWQVDARDIVYADEKSPLDLYRTILRIDDARKRVFAQVGGSLVILSPIGSKALSIGALMAALERDFTVMYVESIGYTVDFARMEAVRSHQPSDIVHVWLHGEAYASMGDTEVTRQ